ncbi:hypothetical protein BST61_g6736 [Cercospora zeina]
MSFDFGVGIGAVVEGDNVSPKENFLRKWHLAVQRLTRIQVPIFMLRDWYNRSQLLFDHDVWIPPIFDYKLGLAVYIDQANNDLSQREQQFAAQLWTDWEQRTRELGWLQAADLIGKYAADADNQAPSFKFVWELVWNEAEERLQQNGADQRTIQRFARIRTQLRQDANAHGVCYEAPQWDPQKTAEWYCETVMDRIRWNRLERVRSAWDEFLARASEERSNMEARVAVNYDSHLPPQLPPFTNMYEPWSPFDDSKIPGPDGTWFFKEPIGEGAAGQATLWTKLSPDGSVIARVVLKEVFLNTESKWSETEHWNGPISNREPLEYAIAHHLNALADSENILLHIDYGLHEARAMYRLYLEYCEHGDLQKVIKAHMTAEKRPSTRAVWAVFEALAAAAVLMDRGEFSSETPNGDYSKGVFHHDIKPPNVFLAAPDEESWLEIPTVKLGDYDLAIWKSDPKSSRIGVGTPSYMAHEAAECAQGKDSVHSQEHMFTSKSEIWSLGRTIMALMNLEQDTPYKSREGVIPDNDCSKDPPTFNTQAEAAYPENLRNLVLQCLSKQPAGRPTPSGLWTAIQQEVTSLKYVEASGVSFLRPALSPEEEMAR